MGDVTSTSHFRTKRGHNYILPTTTHFFSAIAKMPIKNGTLHDIIIPPASLTSCRGDICSLTLNGSRPTHSPFRRLEGRTTSICRR